METTFGCEFEFSSDWDLVKKAIESVLGKSELYCYRRGFQTENNKVWHLKTDCMPSDQPELCTPICKRIDIPKIKKVIEQLKAYKVESDDSCGFHIHVKYNGLHHTEAIIALWVAVENVVFKIVHKNRRNNEYCNKISIGKNNVKGIKRSFDKAIENTKKHAININLESKIDTVEFRLAEGTLDSEFVEHWIRLCLAIVESAEQYSIFEFINVRKCKSIEDLSRFMYLPTKTIDFLEKRQKYINEK